MSDLERCRTRGSGGFLASRRVRLIRRHGCTCEFSSTRTRAVCAPYHSHTHAHPHLHTQVSIRSHGRQVRGERGGGPGGGAQGVRVAAQDGGREWGRGRAREQQEGPRRRDGKPLAWCFSRGCKAPGVMCTRTAQRLSPSLDRPHVTIHGMYVYMPVIILVRPQSDHTSCARQLKEAGRRGGSRRARARGSRGRCRAVAALSRVHGFDVAAPLAAPFVTLTLIIMLHVILVSGHARGQQQGQLRAQGL